MYVCAYLHVCVHVCLHACMCTCIHASVCIPGCVCICICSYEGTCAYFHVGKYVCASGDMEVCLQQEEVKAGKICIRCWCSLSQTTPDFSFHGGSLGIFSRSRTVFRQKTKLLIPHARSMSLPRALTQPRTRKGRAYHPCRHGDKGSTKGRVLQGIVATLHLQYLGC